MNKQVRQIDTDIRRQSETLGKAKREATNLYKQGQKEASLIIVQYSVRLQKSIGRLHIAKAQMQQMQDSLEATIGSKQSVDALRSTTETMQAMSNLMRVPEVRSTVLQLARDMERAGLVQGLVDDAVDSIADPDGTMEEEIASELEKIRQEVDMGATQGMVYVPGGARPASSVAASAGFMGAEAEDEEGVASAGAGGF